MEYNLIFKKDIKRIFSFIKLSSSKNEVVSQIMKSQSLKYILEFSDLI